MTEDGEIVGEVRKRAMEISARYGHDLRRYFKHVQEVQEQYKDRLVSQITVVPVRPRRSPEDKPRA